MKSGTGLLFLHSYMHGLGACFCFHLHQQESSLGCGNGEGGAMAAIHLLFCLQHTIEAIDTDVVQGGVGFDGHLVLAGLQLDAIGGSDGDDVRHVLLHLHFHDVG